jgi:hypothetical protein
MLMKSTRSRHALAIRRDRSPAALARRLGELTDRADIAALAEHLPDGDKELAAAMRTIPATLGFALDPDGSNTLSGAPTVTGGALPFTGSVADHRRDWTRAGARRGRRGIWCTIAARER